MESFPPGWLHALEQPAAEDVVPDFQEVCLATVLLQELPAWLHDYQFSAEDPVDLQRRKPDSELWVDVLTGARSIDSLSDDELNGLHYVATGGASCWAGGSWYDGQLDGSVACWRRRHADGAGNAHT